LEATAFELEQKTALAAEAKQVLDSWVRYEGQVKARQQKELAESIIAKIQKELEIPKTLQQILQQSVADVESQFPRFYGRSIVANSCDRDCLFESAVVNTPLFAFYHTCTEVLNINATSRNRSRRY
jgi:hypothetical protein